MMKKIKFASSILLVFTLLLTACTNSTNVNSPSVIPKIETGKIMSIDKTAGNIKVKTDVEEIEIDVPDEGLLNTLEEDNFYIMNLDDKNTLINAIVDENAKALYAIISEPAKETVSISMTPQLDKTNLNLIKSTALRLPDTNASVYLYNNAVKDSSGEFHYDDITHYILTVQVEDKGEYVLFNGDVQIGKVDYVAFENLDEEVAQTSIISLNAATATVVLNRFNYNPDTETFEAVQIFKSEGNTNLLSVE